MNNPQRQNSALKFTFLHRKPRPYGNFSIENYFRTIGSMLSTKVELTHWEAPCFSKGIFKRLWSIIAVRKAPNADVYHITGDTHFLIWGLKRGRKKVLTIHDLGFLSDAKGLKRKILTYFWLTGPMKHADAVTTVSTATKNDILRFFPTWRKNIHVIPTVVDPRFMREEKEFNTQCPTILLIGSAPNKNLKRVLQATKGLTVHLSIVAELDAEEIELLSGQSYEIDSRISFESLQDKYRQADVLMLCSTLEGFGMPIIEAQAMGRVVITSNLSSMPDVAGKGALLVDPLNINSIQSALRKILSDELLRKQLIEYGFENVKRFDATTVSEMYLELYQSLLQAHA
jgi:glycosyltransferase involved in cell wall biosynthesis